MAPLVAGAGLDLEDVTVATAGRRALVRVVVDADGGADLDAIARVSGAISEALDGDDAAFVGPFVLEVTSPGVDRPLREPRHWRRASGRLVEVAIDGEPASGRVVEVTDDGVTLDLDGQARHVCWARLGAGRVRVEFSRDEQNGND